MKKISIEQGGFNATGIDTSSTIRVRTSDFIPFNSARKVMLLGNNLRISVHYYSNNEGSNISYDDWQNVSSGQVVTITPVVGANYFRFAISFENNSTITPNDVICYVFYTDVNIIDLNGLNRFNYMSQLFAKNVELVQGGYGANGTSNSQENRIRNDEYIPLSSYSGIKVYGKNLRISVHYYSGQATPSLGFSSWENVEDGKTFILEPLSGAKYFKFALSYEDNSNISVQDAKAYYVSTTAKSEIKSILENIWNESYYVFPSVFETIKMEQGTFYDNGTNIEQANRIRNVDYIDLSVIKGLKIVGTGIDIAFSYFTSKGITRIYNSDWININGEKDFILGDIEGAKYLRFVLRKTDASNITPNDAKCYSSIVSAINCLQNNYKERPVYTIGSDLLKRQTGVLSKKLGSLRGTLVGHQAFLKYNNNYYATDGSSIAVFNSSFVQQSITTLSLGHANSMQLGNSNIAYVSGWDDQTIYKVDLSTLTVIGTISLPTTGETTCAVDENNNVVYIFQTGAHNSYQYYNFIKYDLTNSQIVFTKKLNVKMAAIQGLDFCQGKIIVSSGGGTTSLPNHFFTFDTNGNVLSEIIIDYVSTTEPEGIFVDRTTNEILIACSYSSADVYKITGD